MGRSLTGACEYKCGNLHILKMGVRQLGILKILLIWQRVGKKKKKKTHREIGRKQVHTQGLYNGLPPSVMVLLLD